MKKIIIVLVLFLLFPNFISAASVTIDMNNNRVLMENNKDEQRLIASTTKIMTAILAIESNKLEEVVEVGEEVLKMYGSNIYIEYHEHMLLLDLVYGLMLRSGNDAAVVIANYVGGNYENFISMMNEKAKKIGMRNTIFNNPHGLDEETQNYSTAYDLAILYSYAYKNEIFKKIVGTKAYQTESDLKAYEWLNRADILFKYDKTTGAKTGYTPLAGRILVSSASFNNMDICTVTFDKNSYLDNYHETTYENIFSNYKNYLILDKKNFVIEDEEKDIYLKNSYSVLLTEEEYQNIDIKTNIYKEVKNNIYGEVLVFLEDEVIYKDYIYIKNEELSFFEKIKLFFTNKLVFNK